MQDADTEYNMILFLWPKYFNICNVSVYKFRAKLEGIPTKLFFILFYFFSHLFLLVGG